MESDDDEFSDLALFLHGITRLYHPIPVCFYIMYRARGIIRPMSRLRLGMIINRGGLDSYTRLE